MQRLLPADAGDPLEGIGDRADRPAPPGRPWVMANMVMSVDGAYAVEGRSGGLSGEADKQVFALLRGVADAVLVAAGTARTERYRRPRNSDELRRRRRDQGLPPDPRLVLVSRSLAIPADLPLVEGEGPAPLVLGPTGVDGGDLPAGLELRTTGGDGAVDLDAALSDLHADGHRVVLCEGGPSLLGELHELDLLDELFVSISPTLVGGDRVGLLGGADAVARPVHLHRLLTQDGFLFATYRRPR